MMSIPLLVCLITPARLGSGVYRESKELLLCFALDKFGLKFVSFFLYPVANSSGCLLEQHLFPIVDIYSYQQTFSTFISQS
jgi:hypothetical protein